MPAIANIALNDAQATPVLHTFAPVNQDAKGTWWWEDQTGVSPLGFNRISADFKRLGNPAAGATSASRVSRVNFSIHTPKLEALSNNSAGYTPAPTVAYIPRFNGEFILPERASLQDRKDLRKYAQFLLADASVIAMVETLLGIY